MKNKENGTDKNISLVAGWNLIGYSGDTNLSIEDATFTNSSGSRKTWAQAVSEGKVKPYLRYYDSSSATKSQRKYKYVATSDLDMDDNKLVKGKGYWVYANQSGNLTLTSVNGTSANQNYRYDKIRIRNSTGSEMTITEAKSLGYLNSYINYWDTSVNAFRTICDNLDDCSSVSPLDSSKGYFIKINEDNITLIRNN